MLRLLKGSLQILSLILILFSVSRAQAPNLVWWDTCGGEYSEVAYDGTATADGCFVIAGYTSSFGAWQCDGYLVKYNIFGDTLWTRMFGESYYDYVMDVIATSDACIALAGKHSFPSSGIRKAWFMKFDLDGNELIERNFVSTYDLETNGLCETSDSGFAIVGYTPSASNGREMFLLRLDANGDSLWMQTYGDSLNEEAFAVAQTADSGFFMVGYTESHGAGGKDLYMVRTDKEGTFLWGQTYGSEENEGTPMLIRANDGTFVVGVPTMITNFVATLINIDEEGTVNWTQPVDPGDSYTLMNLCQTRDDGFLLTGNASYGYPLGGQVYIIRTDYSGSILWTSNYGGNSSDNGKFIHETDLGEIIVGGNYASSGYGQYYALKLEATNAVGVGPGVSFAMGDGVEFYFDTVTAEGSVFLSVTDTGPDPDIFDIVPNNPPVYYNITTTAAFEDYIEICITYDDAGLTLEDEEQLQLMHYESGEWYNITSSLDVGANVICGQTTTLSPFVVASPSEPNAVGDEDDDLLPGSFILSQNYPNPFNPSTAIKYTLEYRSHVLLTVYNTLGQNVRTLVDGSESIGDHTVYWDGCDDRGNQLAGGVYLYRLKTDDYTQTRKMILLK